MDVSKVIGYFIEPWPTYRWIKEASIRSREHNKGKNKMGSSREELAQIGESKNIFEIGRKFGIASSVAGGLIYNSCDQCVCIWR